MDICKLLPKSPHGGKLRGTFLGEDGAGNSRSELAKPTVIANMTLKVKKGVLANMDVNTYYTRKGVLWTVNLEVTRLHRASRSSPRNFLESCGWAEERPAVHH